MQGRAVCHWEHFALKVGMLAHLPVMAFHKAVRQPEYRHQDLHDDEACKGQQRRDTLNLMLLEYGRVKTHALLHGALWMLMIRTECLRQELGL